MNLLALRAGGRRISQIAQWISVGMFIGMFVLFVVSVIQRYVLVRPVNWVDESILILFLWSTFLTEALVLREREQVTFDVIWDLAGPGLRRAIGLLAAGLIIWMLRAHAGQKLFSFALACILGGAVGNVIDRILYGYVVDFLDFHWSWLSPVFAGGHFPAFNIADAAITVGATCLILDELLRVRRSR